jgi:aspartyl-tRNA(Asn)/glutamyl-tRNA(Gln) amidotransferase subunit C
MISKEEIKKLADLARIDIRDEEIENLRSEMDAILDYVKLIQQFHPDEAFSKENAEEGLEAGTLHNVMREDENPTTAETHSKELIAEFPEARNNYLKVKKIL